MLETIIDWLHAYYFLNKLFKNSCQTVILNNKLTNLRFSVDPDKFHLGSKINISLLPWWSAVLVLCLEQVSNQPPNLRVDSLLVFLRLQANLRGAGVRVPEPAGGGPVRGLAGVPFVLCVERARSLDVLPHFKPRRRRGRQLLLPGQDTGLQGQAPGTMGTKHILPGCGRAF